MALSQNVLQKKRTKKSTKRNDKRITGARLGALLSFSRDWAAAIFGDVDAAVCPVKFAFGHDDKSFYVSGPHDSLSMQRRIVTQLERRCGTDGFHFMISEASEGLD